MNTRATRPSRALTLVALAALVLGMLALTGIDANALCVLPALVLVVPLIMRSYPGERVLAALGARCSRRPRLRGAAPRTGRILIAAPHGGSLIARSLAVRPPPALRSAS